MNYIISYKTTASNLEQTYNVTSNSPKQALEVLADELTEAFKHRTGSLSIYKTEEAYQNKKPSKIYSRKEILDMFAPKQRHALGQNGQNLIQRIKTNPTSIGTAHKLIGVEAPGKISHDIILGK